MRGYKLISFGEFSYICPCVQTGDFQTFCTLDKPDAMGWIPECTPSNCKKWRKLSRAKNKELSKPAHNTLKAAIALVRAEAFKQNHHPGGMLHQYLKDIEQRAAV